MVVCELLADVDEEVSLLALQDLQSGHLTDSANVIG